MSLTLLFTCAPLLLLACDSDDDRLEPALTPPPLLTSEAPYSTPSSSPSASASASYVPARKVFDTEAMQVEVQRLLMQSYEIENVQRVECPPDQPVQPGLRFDCVAQIGATPKPVAITVMTAEGDYRVGMPRDGE